MTIASSFHRLRHFAFGEAFRSATSRIVDELNQKPAASAADQANDLYFLATQIQAAAVAKNASAAANVAAAPAIASITQATGALDIVVVFSGADLAGYSAPAQWATVPARTITRVSQTAERELTITYSGVSLTAGATLAFDAPVTPTLKSFYGVAVADAAAALITIA
jgi:hypothetical protein